MNAQPVLPLPVPNAPHGQFGVVIIVVNIIVIRLAPLFDLHAHVMCDASRLPSSYIGLIWPAPHPLTPAVHYITSHHITYHHITYAEVRLSNDVCDILCVGTMVAVLDSSGVDCGVLCCMGTTSTARTLASMRECSDDVRRAKGEATPTSMLCRMKMEFLRHNVTMWHNNG